VNVINQHEPTKDDTKHEIDKDISAVTTKDVDLRYKPVQSHLPWYMKDGDIKPIVATNTNIRDEYTLAIFPEERPGGDRITGEIYQQRGTKKPFYKKPVYKKHSLRK